MSEVVFISLITVQGRVVTGFYSNRPERFRIKVIVRASVEQLTFRIDTTAILQATLNLLCPLYS